MALPKTTPNKARALSLALFLIGLAFLAYFKSWWPSIMLVIGIPLAIREYLLGRYVDMAISLFVFIGIFITVQFKIKWDILLPILFAVGGIYVFVREYFIRKETKEEEKK